MAGFERPETGRDLVFLYDGACAVCTASAAWVEARDTAGRIERLDLQKPENAARFPSFTAEAVRAQMHAVTTRGEVLIGIDAVRVVLAHLPRWRIIAGVLGIPGLRSIFQWFYLLFARNRYVFNPLLGRHPPKCDGDACAVDWSRPPPTVASGTVLSGKPAFARPLLKRPTEGEP